MKNLSIVFCLLASLSCAAVSKGESSHASRRSPSESHSPNSISESLRPRSSSSSKKEAVKSSGVTTRPVSNAKESKGALLVTKPATSDSKKNAKAVLPTPVARGRKNSVTSDDSLMSKVTGIFGKRSSKSGSRSSSSSEGKKKRRSSSAKRSAAAKGKGKGRSSSSSTASKSKTFYSRIARKVRRTNMKTAFMLVAISLGILGVVGIGLLVLPRSFRPGVGTKASTELSSDPTTWCTEINCKKHVHRNLPLYLRQ